MKKLRLTRLVLMFMMALVPLAAAAQKGIYYNANYDFSNLTLGTDTLGGVNYLTVNYDGLDNGGEPGMPSLPVDYIRFSVPRNATNFSVGAQLRNTVTQDVGQLVYPCQPPRMMSDTTPVVITLPDSTAYLNYPLQRAWVVDEGYLAGENHIVTVAVMPISFNMIGTGGINYNQLKKTPTITLMLSYQLSDSLAMYPIVRQDSILRQEGYALTRSMVVNPSSVEAHATGEIQSDFIFNPTSGDGLNGGPYIDPTPPPVNNDSIIGSTEQIQIEQFPYLIITTQEMLHSVRRIAALKRQKGYGVKVMTIGDVLNSLEAGQGDVVNHELTYTDDAGKLRQFLKYCYRRYGTQYVLLAGNGVPYRYTTMKPFDKKPSITFPSDLYFSDFNGNWKDSIIDFDPEVYVGRILAKSPDQISNYTDKLFRYELNPGNGNTGYLNRAFFSFGYDLASNGEISTVLNSAKNIYSDTTIFQESLEITDKLDFPTGRDIINEINDTGYALLSLHHHGEPSSLITYGYRNGAHWDKYYFLWAIDSIHVTGSGYAAEDTLTGNGLNNLTNKYYPNLCYSVACSTIPFDTMDGFENIPMVFGESFTTGKDYGGPAFIGNTRDGVVSTSAGLEKKFFNEIDSGYHKIGEANGFAKVNYSSYSSKLIDYVCTVQNLLGDPQLDLWTDIPQEFSNIAIARSDSSIYISGINVDSIPTTIGYYYKNSSSNNGYYRQLKLTKSMVVLNNASPNWPIVIYKHNYLPYIAPLYLQNVNFNKSQYVIATDVTAGHLVDSNRTPGYVTVKNGVEYEIEASGTVTLQGGFTVEKGATFAVYPSCF